MSFRLNPVSGLQMFPVIIAKPLFTRENPIEIQNLFSEGVLATANTQLGSEDTRKRHKKSLKKKKNEIYKPPNSNVN